MSEGENAFGLIHPLTRTLLFRNFLAETCHSNTQKYKNLFSQAKSSGFLCGLQANYDEQFNQGVRLRVCQLILQENTALYCIYK